MLQYFITFFLSNSHHSTINYRQRAARRILRTCLFCDWKSAPLSAVLISRPTLPILSLISACPGVLAENPEQWLQFPLLPLGGAGGSLAPRLGREIAWSTCTWTRSYRCPNNRQRPRLRGRVLISPRPTLQGKRCRGRQAFTVSPRLRRK